MKYNNKANENNLHEIHNSNKKIIRTLPPLDTEGRGSATMFGNCEKSNNVLNLSTISTRRSPAISTRRSPSICNPIRISPTINNRNTR